MALRLVDSRVARAQHDPDAIGPVLSDQGLEGLLQLRAADRQLEQTVRAHVPLRLGNLWQVARNGSEPDLTARDIPLHFMHPRRDATTIVRQRLGISDAQGRSREESGKDNGHHGSLVCAR